MEIRNVIKEVKNEYPKIKKISKENLLNNIPNKWLKVGISSLVISMIMKNKAFAASIGVEPSGYTAAGGFPTYIPAPVKICNTVCPIIQIVSVSIFIITGLIILTTRIKSKKKSENKEVKKWIKFLFIISIIVFILSIVIRFIVNAIY